MTLLPADDVPSFDRVSPVVYHSKQFFLRDPRVLRPVLISA